MRFRNERWHDRRGLAVERRRGRRASRPYAGRTAAPGTCSGRARAGPRRPAPSPSTGWSWSRPFIACIADGQPDAALEPALEAVSAGRLGPHGAVVAAPEEADEAEAGLVRPANTSVTSRPGIARSVRLCQRLEPMRTYVRVSEATILHADLDAFFAVGRAARRSAAARPAGDRRRRVVLAASYEAKAYGVRTAMSGAQARRLCPRAIVVEPRMSAYAEASKAVYRGVRGHDAAGRGAVDRRGVPRRPRAAAALGHADRDRRAAAARRARAGRACRSRSGSRGRSSSPRWRAGWPSRTVCSWCRPTASSPSCTRCRSSGSGASGR